MRLTIVCQIGFIASSVKLEYNVADLTCSAPPAPCRDTPRARLPVLPLADHLPREPAGLHPGLHRGAHLEPELPGHLARSSNNNFNFYNQRRA